MVLPLQCGLPESLLFKKPTLACRNLPIHFCDDAPIIGAIGGLVAAVIVAMRGLRVLKRFIIPTVFAVGASVGWLLLTFSNKTIGNGSIPVSDWHSLASLFNAHFYPINFGVFDIWLGQQHFTPLLSL